MWGTIKRRQSDILFSQYLRKKIGRCEVCGKLNGLEVSHFFGRRSESTRHSEENCDILCHYHHRKFHESPSSYVEWKKQKLGDKRYKQLEIAANSYKKKDEKMAVIIIKQLIKDYERL